MIRRPPISTQSRSSAASDVYKRQFLYVAYRELRALEYELKAKIVTLAETTGVAKPAGPLPYVPLTNMHGIDIERVAVMIARVTLWMGHRQVMDMYGAVSYTHLTLPTIY